MCWMKVNSGNKTDDDDDDMELLYIHLASQENLEVEKDLHVSMSIADDCEKERENIVIIDSGSTTNLFRVGWRHLLQNFRWVKNE